MGIWGQGRAFVCIDTQSGRVQRYLRANAGHPIHAGRAYVTMEGSGLAEVIEAFRDNPDQFVVEPEAA